MPLHFEVFVVRKAVQPAPRLRNNSPWGDVSGPKKTRLSYAFLLSKNRSCSHLLCAFLWSLKRNLNRVVLSCLFCERDLWPSSQAQRNNHLSSWLNIPFSPEPAWLIGKSITNSPQSHHLSYFLGHFMLDSHRVGPVANGAHLELLAPFSCLAHTPRYTIIPWSSRGIETLVSSIYQLVYLKSYPIHLPMFQLQVFHSQASPTHVQPYPRPRHFWLVSKRCFNDSNSSFTWIPRLHHFPTPNHQEPFQCLVSMFLGTLQLQGLRSLRSKPPKNERNETQPESPQGFFP